MLFNNTYYLKARRWSQIFFLLAGTTFTLLIGAVGWRIGRYKELVRINQALRSHCANYTQKLSIKDSIECDYTHLQQRYQHLNSQKKHCFMIEFLDYLAPILDENVRLDCLIAQEASTIRLTGQAHQAEYVFALIELLESQEWFALVKLESVHKSTTDDDVIFSIYLTRAVN